MLKDKRREKLACPFCEHEDSKVKDSRPDPRGGYSRKRECQSCRRKWFTLETNDPRRKYRQPTTSRENIST